MCNARLVYFFLHVCEYFRTVSYHKYRGASARCTFPFHNEGGSERKEDKGFVTGKTGDERAKCQSVANVECGDSEL